MAERACQQEAVGCVPQIHLKWPKNPPVKGGRQRATPTFKMAERANKLKSVGRWAMPIIKLNGRNK